MPEGDPTLLGFFSSLTSTLIGAFAGAWGAYRFARRARRHDALRDEFAAINAAILISSNIRSTMLNSKRDHVLPMMDRYQTQLAKYAVVDSNRRYYGKREVAEILLDGKSISKPTLPIDDLYRLIFDRIHANGRPKLLVTALKQSALLYFEVVTDRNAALALQKERMLPAQKFISLYLGLQTPEGRDETFKTMVRLHGRYVDDAIWFSNQICGDLHSYGQELRKETKIKNTAVLKVGLDPPNLKLIPKGKYFDSYMQQQIHLKPVAKTRKWKFWISKDLKKN